MERVARARVQALLTAARTRAKVRRQSRPQICASHGGEKFCTRRKEIVLLMRLGPLLGTALVLLGSASPAFARGKNLAQGMTATQSSTHDKFGADRAVDGRTDGNLGNNSVAHTNQENQPWWQVDLGQVYQIDEI